VKVAIAVLDYLPSVGGSVRVVQLLAEGVAKRGNEVTVVTREKTGCPTEESIGGVRVLRIPMRHLAGYRLPKGYLRTLRTLDADVFHVHGNRIWNVDYYLPFAGSFDWPQVITPHGFYHYWMRSGPVRYLYYNQYFSRRIRKFDRYVALTAGEANHVLSWRYPPERLSVIPNGIEVEEFDTPPYLDTKITREWLGLRTKKVAVYVGGFWDNKRVDRLIEAIARTNGEWGLVEIGNDRPGHPYDREHCLALTRSLGTRAVFLRELSRSALLDIFHSADAYVQGSAFEGFGITLLEAMAADLPFVAFDSGAARELAATGAGRVVATPEEMARALGDIPSWYTPGTGRKAVTNWTAEKMVDRHVALYESIRKER